MTVNQELISKIKNFDSVPVISLQALRLLRDENASVPQVTQCFEYCPGITANIIKLANSSLYSGNFTVKTLQEAIVRIGFKRTLEFLISMTLAPTLNKPVKGYDMAPGQMWQSSVSGAIFAEIINRETGYQKSDMLFTCCMLRDIGKLLLENLLEESAKKIIAEAVDNAMPFNLAEKKFLGLDHGEAGAILMEHWNMPEELIMTAKYHHCPSDFSGDEKIAEIIAIVHLADIFSAITRGSGIDGLNYNLDNNVAEAFEIDSDMADRIIYQHELELDELKETGII